MGLRKWHSPTQSFGDVTFYNSRRGQEAILCCTGPSLEKSPLDKIQQSKKLIVGLNNAFLKIKPDIWIGFDEPEAFADSLWHTSFDKFYNSAWEREGYEGQPIKEVAGMHFFNVMRATDLIKLSPSELQGLASNRPYMDFLYEGCTFSVAMSILKWMGIGKIYLVGCDMGGSNKLSAAGPKYNKEEYDIEAQENAIANALSLLKDIVKYNGFELVSCTPNSPINEFMKFFPAANL